MLSCLLEFISGQSLWEGFPFCRGGMHQVYRTYETLCGRVGCRKQLVGMGSGNWGKEEV